MSLRTFPKAEWIEAKAAATPEFMRPSLVPYAVEFEGWLTAEQCDHILSSLEQIEAYNFSGCHARTRECDSHPSLDPIEAFARGINDMYWQYDLDPGQHSWLQTYTEGGKYLGHIDGAPGQTRKLTAVAMLTDPEDYKGGWLNMSVVNKSYQVSNTRGTIVVFRSWIEHEVTTISKGCRQTINMGFWGPPFR